LIFFEYRNVFFNLCDHQSVKKVIISFFLILRLDFNFNKDPIFGEVVLAKKELMENNIS